MHHLFSPSFYLTADTRWLTQTNISAKSGTIKCHDLRSNLEPSPPASPERERWRAGFWFQPFDAWNWLKYQLVCLWLLNNSIFALPSNTAPFITYVTSLISILSACVCVGQRQISFNFVFRAFVIKFWGDSSWLMAHSSKLVVLKKYLKTFITHEAPEPRVTADMVLARILMSSHNDQLSIYSISSSIHFSNGMPDRPSTCQRQVIPGRTLKRRRCQSWSKPL